MPVSPSMALRLAQDLRAVYEDAANKLIRAIAAQVGRGAQDPNWMDRKLEAMSLLMHEADAVISDLRNGVPGAVEEALKFAYRRGGAVGAADMEAAGVEGGFTFMPDNAAISSLLSEAMRPHEQIISRIRRSVQDAYDDAITRASQTVLTGSGTRQDAARQALRDLADRGITGFTDRSGRQWELASYAEMATRTSAGHAAIQGHTDRLQSLGQDLVIVSDSPEECDLCRPFEGRVLSISGRTTGTLSDGAKVMCSVQEAQRRGLYHPNCTHSQGIYLPGITEPMTDTEAPDDYENRQRQRAYERRVRQWRRRVEVEEGVSGKQSPESKAARRKLREVNAEYTAWLNQKGRRRVSGRTNLNHR